LGGIARHRHRGRQAAVAEIGNPGMHVQPIAEKDIPLPVGVGKPHAKREKNRAKGDSAGILSPFHREAPASLKIP
jgi:hypothetical protein